MKELIIYWTKNKKYNFIPMVENETVLIGQSFVSNIKIVRFVAVHCLFDMNCDCLIKELKVAVKPVSTIKISIA